jgi:hypothetical protein
LFEDSFSSITARAHHDSAAPGLLIVLDSLSPVDETTGWEVGALDHLPEIADGRFRIVEQVNGGDDDFPQVVRRDVRRHADRDTR